MTRIVKTPNRSNINPDIKISFATTVFASGFFSGFSPAASGTLGSAVALAIYCIPGFEQSHILIPVLLATFILGVFASKQMEKKYGHDPAEVTIDEVAGMWISLAFLPKGIMIAAAAFLFFRIFDIIKPYPAQKFDDMNGGFGIMMDDVVAGLYANILVQVLLFIPITREWLYLL